MLEKEQTSQFAFDAMALDPSASASPADLPLQQGMSPTSTPLLEGENRGPTYGHLATEPLRDLLNEVNQRGTTGSLPNGVPAVSTVDGSGHGDIAPTVQPAVVDQGDHGSAPCQLSPSGGTMLSEPSGTRDVTGPVPSMPSVTAPGRDDRSVYQAPVFPRFVPSPLPGQSPVSGQGPTRATTWLSRIGDYLQRTVEVTAWTSQGVALQQAVGQWSDNDGAAAFGMPPTSMSTRSVQMTADEKPPSSSGSAGVSPAVVQAEVAKQLESAMSDLHERLRLEQRRSSEAVREAQMLRRQLEQQEVQRASDSQPLAALLPPPGLQIQEGHGPGVYTGVTSSHTPLVPEVNPPRLPVQDVVYHRDDVPQDHRAEVPPRDHAGGQAGLVYNDGAGVSGVTASHTPSGPFVSLPSIRQRSQSPGPRAFFSGLFSRGGTSRADRPGDDGRTGGPLAGGGDGIPQEASAGPMRDASLPIAAPSATPEGNLLATLARGIESL